MTTLYPGATNYDLCRTESGTHTAQVIIGDTNDVTCPLGTEYHVTLEGLKGCRPCPRGTYRDSKSASYCWQCSNGQSTPLAGAARGSLCGSNAAPDEGDFFESGSSAMHDAANTAVKCYQYSRKLSPRNRVESRAPDVHRVRLWFLQSGGFPS